MALWTHLLLLLHKRKINAQHQYSTRNLGLGLLSTKALIRNNFEASSYTMSATLRKNKQVVRKGAIFSGLLGLSALQISESFTSPSSFYNIKESRADVNRISHIPRPLNAFPGFSELLDFSAQIPFDNYAKDLFNEMDIGGSLEFTTNQIPEDQTSMVLDSIGRDLLVFLAASVVVTPFSKALKITPILGYLILGAILGPHALNIFSNTKADVELGDFGILFLLFSEGLEVTSLRLKKLANYIPLGLAQITLTAGVLSAGILSAPQFLERFIPLDSGLINISNPLEALILALAGTLSTSAFVFPVSKEKEWEDDKSGEAATSVLLLQDLAVAPLLVSLPFIAGQTVGDSGAISFLTLKALVGFGSVIYVGSFFLERLFQLVAQAKSTETFVALCLLVSVGMGAIAKIAGLTDTAGAFAAGVLLANTNYRAQVQADILPFKGILLGIFFMDAGSSFDSELVLRELPTIITGVVALITLKASTVFAATKVPRWMEPNRLPEKDALKLALLLAGGGEFAFVVLALAEKLDVLPKDLGGLLTAIVLLSMALTPSLGDLADKLSGTIKRSAPVNSDFIEPDKNGLMEESTSIASDAIIVCGHGEIGSMVVKTLEQNISIITTLGDQHGDIATSDLPKIVSFDTDPNLVDKLVLPEQDVVALFGDGSNPEVLRSSGVTNPTAIFVSYQESNEVLSATSRLRNAFENAPIYARAQTRVEAQLLKAAGASEVVIEADELSRSAMALLRGLGIKDSPETLHILVARAAGMSVKEVEDLLVWFNCMDQDGTGLLKPTQLANVVKKSNSGVLTDDEIIQMEEWILSVVKKPVDYIEFCKMYVKAPETVRQALTDGCLL